MEVPVAQLVEGCNAVGVMILFAAFVFAILQRLMPTFIFILLGLVLLYGMNILRIALISLGIFWQPDWSSALHDLVFPGIIYGTVLLLWIFWIWCYNLIYKSDE